MIEVDIWKCWIMKQVMTEFGSLKIEKGGDTMISSDAIYYSGNFGQLFYRFLYRQNKLGSIRTVSILNVTTCFMISSFQILMKIICPIYCDNVCDQLYTHPNVWYFFRIWLHFYHQVLVIDLQIFKYVEHVHSINQMRLFWLPNIKYFSIILLKYILFYCISSNQNKSIWCIEYTYFTYLKNCSSIANAWR